MSSVNCPPPPPPSQQDVDSILPKILAQMNIPKCEKVAGGGLVVAIPPIIGGVAASSGCEQISIIASKYIQTQQILTCIMNQVKQTSKASLRGVQSISFTADDSVVNCNTINITQNMTLDFYDQNKFTQEIKSQMSTVLKNFITESMDTVQKSNTGYLATPQGQKAFQDAITQIKQNITTEQLANIIEESILLVQPKQNMNITLKNHSILQGSDCNFTQNMLLKLAINNMFSSTMKETMGLEAVTKFFSDQGTFMKNKAKGLELGLGGGLLFILLIIGGFVMFGGNIVNKIFKYIFPILIIVNIVLMIVYATKKNWTIVGILSGSLVLLVILEMVNLKKDGGEHPLTELKNSVSKQNEQK